MKANLNLKAALRENLGSSDSRRIRKSKRIPAVIQDRGGKNINITVDGREFEREYFKGDILTTIVKIDIDGKNFDVIANKVDVNPVTDLPTHVDFTKVNKGEKVRAWVKVRFFNREKCPGLRKGGFLHVVLRKIELICNQDSIPEEITFNLNKMRVGDKVRSEELNLPDDVELYRKNNTLVASIIGRAAKEEEASVETEAESGAESAEAGAEASGEKKDEKTEDKK